MTLPTPSDDAGGGIAFRLFGFPIRIDPFFLVVLGLLGWTGAGSFDRLLVWVLIGVVAIVLHELGHAFVARTTGAHPTITLYGLGGVTMFVPPRPMSRLMSLAVSLAGPLVGVAIGLALLLAVPRDAVTPGSLSAYALDVAVFVNLGWGVLNLLPVLPLDGGHVLEQVLPGSPETRARTAAIISIVVAAAGAVAAYSFGMTYAALLAAWLGVSNALSLRRATSGATLPRLPETSEVDRSALWLVDQGRVDDARHLVQTADGGTVHLAVEGLVTALSGRQRVGGEMVVRAVQNRPDDPTAVGAYARLLAAAHDWERLRQLLDTPVGHLVPPHVAALLPDARGDGDSPR